MMVAVFMISSIQRASLRHKSKDLFYSSNILKYLSSTSNMKIWTVDSFTKTPFKGNPAGVVAIMDDDDNDIFTNDSKCLEISSEINLSETAFIKKRKCLSSSDDYNHYQIRWFTPKIEVDLCGHATLAAAHIICTENPFGQNNIANSNHNDSSGSISGYEITFESIKSGLKLNVMRSEEEERENRYTLDFPLQPINEKNIEIDDKILDIFDNNSNIINNIVKSLDNDATIIEVCDVDYLKNKIFDNNKILNNINTRGLIVTVAAASSDKYDFYTRYFAPKSGIIEDPVTGSAHCKLVDYWNKKLGGKKIKFKAYQLSSRGGELDLEIVSGDRVHITGSAVTVFKVSMCC